MGIHLIVDYYEDERPDRREEFLVCMRRNLNHPHIEAVYNLGSNRYAPPADIREHPKYRSHPTGHRLTFKDAFEFASASLPGQFVGMCNLDIFLDDSSSDWLTAEQLVRQHNLVLCQSRIERAADGTTSQDQTFARLLFANAQDAWFFIAPLEVPNAAFELGTLGCDNAIADRIRKAGRIPINLGSRFKVVHVDICRGKHGANTNLLHAQESKERDTVYSRFPERDGCYLVPDFDMATSLDAIMDALSIAPLHKYRVICDIMSQIIKIQN
ncbi:MAG: hypothetical protein WCH77_09560 [Planctomycetota bacterium]